MTEFRIDISKKGKAKGGEVRIQGEMTVINACQARDALIEAFSAERICVDVQDITAIDLTGLQLLCAAHRAALAGSKTLEVSGVENEAFIAAAEAAGMLRHVGCKRDEKNTCIWVGGN